MLDMVGFGRANRIHGTKYAEVINAKCAAN